MQDTWLNIEQVNCSEYCFGIMDSVTRSYLFFPVWNGKKCSTHIFCDNPKIFLSAKKCYEFSTAVTLEPLEPLDSPSKSIT